MSDCNEWFQRDSQRCLEECRCAADMSTYFIFGERTSKALCGKRLCRFMRLDRASPTNFCNPLMTSLLAINIDMTKFSIFQHIFATADNKSRAKRVIRYDSFLDAHASALRRYVSGVLHCSLVMARTIRMLTTRRYSDLILKCNSKSSRFIKLLCVRNPSSFRILVNPKGLW